MKFPLLALLYAFTEAATSTSSTGVSIASGSVPTITNAAVTSSVNNSVVEYSITDLPAVSAQPACLFNCLNPIGLADPSDCDDITNDCACLSAPAGAASAIQDCISTVCESSISEYGDIATSLYIGYCSSIYGSSSLASAASAEQVEDSSAAASSSSAAQLSSEEATKTASVTLPGSSAAIPSAKSSANTFMPS
jgi:hypothetical protein